MPRVPSGTAAHEFASRCSARVMAIASTGAPSLPNVGRLDRVGPSGTSVQDVGRPEESGGEQPPRGGDGHPERGAVGTTSDPGAG